MNRLIIIGNGFDLAHGLKTSYLSFMTWYLDKFITEFFESDPKIEMTGIGRSCLWNKQDKLLMLDFKINTSPFLVDEKSHPIFDEYNSYKKEKEKKPWLFLSQLSRNYGLVVKVLKSELLNSITVNIERKGWTDIERDYYELLKNNYAKHDECVRLNEQMDFLRSKLSYYLNSKHIDNYSTEVLGKLQREIDIKEISQSTKSFFEEVERKRFSLNGEEDIKRHLALGRTMLLDFNYTNTSNIYHTITSFDVNHIHGSLEEPDKMIFGYGDEMDKDFKMLEDKNDNELLKNSKSVKYLESSHYRDMLDFLNTDLYQVYIMGHSCGNSDRTLLNTIFEHKNCASIKPFYYVNDKGEDNYSDIAMNIYRNFKDKALFRERVVNKEFCTTIIGN